MARLPKAIARWVFPIPGLPYRYRLLCRSIQSPFSSSRNTRPIFSFTLEKSKDSIEQLLGKRASWGVCNFSCPGQVYRWGGAIRPSSFLRLGNPQSGQKGRSLSAIARVVKHSWNCARPKASADRPEQMPRKVLAQPERLPIACGLGDAKRSACSPPSHAAASAGVTGAEPLSRGWQSVQAFHLG